MSNPFKVGDKVMRKSNALGDVFSEHEHTVFTVVAVEENDVQISPAPDDEDDGWWLVACFRAAIAGQDYPVPERLSGHDHAAVYQGHLPDGSSVQAHSAGGLYPVVLVYRDKVGGPNADGKYDVGVISPKNQDPIWFKSSDAAIAVAEAIQANL